MNGINPLKLLQLKSSWEQFQNRHPQISGLSERGGPGASLKQEPLDVTITSPAGGRIGSNLKLTAEDIQLLQELKELKKVGRFCSGCTVRLCGEIRTPDALPHPGGSDICLIIGGRLVRLCFSLSFLLLTLQKGQAAR